jgi:membrane-associated protein
MTLLADLLDLLTGLLDHPAAVPLILVLAVLDGFAPVVPSETVVVAAAAMSFHGTGPWLPLVWLFATTGAIVGDRVSYAIGARLRGAPPGTRRARVLAAAEQALRERGGTLIVSARFVPGGRTATTMACGATGFPPARFAALTALSGALWATFCVVLGYLGTLLGGDVQGSVLWGCALAFGVAGGSELVRWLTRRRRRAGVGQTVAEPAKEIR